MRRFSLRFALPWTFVLVASGCPADDEPSAETGSETESSSTGNTATSAPATTTTTTTTTTSSSTSTTGQTETTASTTVAPTTVGPTTGGGSSESGEGSSSSGAAACDDDPREPNNTERDAAELDDITDGRASSLEGVLDGPDDADWFTFHVEDAFSFLEPSRTLQADGPLRLCKYYRCDVDPGATTVTCDGTDEDVLFDGTPGCCTDGEDLVLSIECPGIDDSGTTIIRITTDSDECINYTLDYGA